MPKASPAEAEARFKQRVVELGGQMLSEYKGSKIPVRCACSEGHVCAPRPEYVQHGGGICRICARKDPVVAEREFRERVAALGGQVLGAYHGANHPVHCLCASAHECTPRPADLRRGCGMCQICAGRDTATAKAAFYSLVAGLGGQVIGQYKGASAPVRCLCASGHVCAPRPTNLQKGRGMCPACAGKAWDAYYAVVSPETGHVKAGITSGNPQARLRDHATRGYTQVELLVTNLPHARDLERNVLQALRDAGIRPHKGREWFPADALPVILDIAANWPVPSEATRRYRETTESQDRMIP